MIKIECIFPSARRLVGAHINDAGLCGGDVASRSAALANVGRCRGFCPRYYMSRLDRKIFIIMPKFTYEKLSNKKVSANGT